MSKPDLRMREEAQQRERELVGLHALSREVPNADAAVAEIARYSAEQPPAHFHRTPLGCGQLAV